MVENVQLFYSCGECLFGRQISYQTNVDPGNLKQPNLHLFSSTLKNYVVMTTHHKNTNLVCN